jgi:hypothetical protein
MGVTKGVAIVNLVIQAILIAGVFAGAWLAWRRKLRWHCRVMRTVMGAQIVLIGIIMAPQLARHFPTNLSWFSAGLLVHHTLGLVALALWIYINLAFTGAVRAPRRYTWFMRSALASWTISLGLGGYVFWDIWR